jgi:hypothetical protein
MVPPSTASDWAGDVAGRSTPGDPDPSVEGTTEPMAVVASRRRKASAFLLVIGFLMGFAAGVAPEA